MRDELDEILVRRIAGGDREAYEAMIERHAGRYLNVAERILMNRAAAEDALQDCFIRLWTHAGRFDPAVARFQTWFHRIVVNRCLDDARRIRPEPLPDGFDLEDGRPDAETVISDTETAQAVRNALAQLPARQRAALVLTYYDGLKNAEAAALLNIGVKAIESLLVRARQNLAKDLRALLRNEEKEQS